MTIKKLLAGIIISSCIVCGVFADEAKYNELKKNAENYEKNNQFAHALGAYWDAMGEEPALAAKDKINNHYDKLRENISNGKPGFGDFDDFELLDGWIALCEDFEIYWTEHANEMHYVTISRIEKDSVDMETRTGKYKVTLAEYNTSKFNDMLSDFKYGLKRSRTKSWDKYIPVQWPAVTVFKDSSKVPIVKYLTATIGNTHKLSVDKFYLTDINDFIPYGNGSVKFESETKPIELSAIPAFLSYVDKTSINSENEISIKILSDDDNHVIAETVNPIKLAKQEVVGSPLLPSLEKTNKTTLEFPAIKSSDMKLLDNGKYHLEIVSYQLKPVSISFILTGEYRFGSFDLFYSDLKRNTNYKTIDLLNTNSNSKIKTRELTKAYSVLLDNEKIVNNSFVELKQTNGEEIYNNLRVYFGSVKGYIFDEDLQFPKGSFQRDEAYEEIAKLLSALTKVEYKWNRQSRVFQRDLNEAEKEAAEVYKKEAEEKAKAEAELKVKEEAEKIKASHPIENAELYDIAFTPETNARVEIKTIDYDGNMALRFEGNTGKVKTQYGWYEITGRDASALELLKKGNTLSFSVLGDGNAYQFLFILDKTTYSYNFSTKKGKVTEVVIPYKKLQYDSWTPSARFDVNKITGFRFNLNRGSGDFHTSNKEFGITIFNSQIN